MAAGRAAFDTVVQGMSGIMDMTRAGGRPVKLGISAADILGSQVTQLAVLSALAAGRTGRFIDIAMHDVAIYAVLCGLTRRDGASRSKHSPVRSVREIARNAAFRERCMTTIPDEKGVARPAVRFPYSIHL